MGIGSTDAGRTGRRTGDAHGISRRPLPQGPAVRNGVVEGLRSAPWAAGVHEPEALAVEINSVRRADHKLLAEGPPCDSEPRREIVSVHIAQVVRIASLRC